MPELTHSSLVKLGSSWLYRQGCGVVISELAGISSSEAPDAIGFRSNASILIECKITRADYRADRKKPFRENPVDGMGDYRFYLAPTGLISVDELPAGWGLLEVKGERVYRRAGGPVGNMWTRMHAPFRGNEQAERGLLYSILRKAHVKGLTPQILETVAQEQIRLSQPTPEQALTTMLNTINKLGLKEHHPELQQAAKTAAMTLEQEPRP